MSLSVIDQNFLLLTVDQLLADSSSSHRAESSKVKGNIVKETIEQKDVICDREEIGAEVSSHVKKRKKNKKKKSKSASDTEEGVDSTKVEESNLNRSEGGDREEPNDDMGVCSKKFDDARAEHTDEQEMNNGTVSERFTDDGFKITSVIPNDDSDVSDAFEYDSEYDDNDDEQMELQVYQDLKNSKTKSSQEQRVTEDGFKIVTAIPSDDSDVSDAFCEEDDTVQEAVTKTQQFGVNRTIKKPILQLMDDFGKSYMRLVCW